jgi:hypothetical protein
MRRPGRRLGIPLTLLVLVLGASGCGGDDDETTSAPSISVPVVSVPTTGGVSVPNVSTTTTPPPDIVTTGKGGTAKPNPAAPDAPSNDLPPPPGSPQEAFERQCEQNPAACG